MSARSSQASGVSTSGSSGRGTRSSSNAKATPTDEQFSEDIGPTSPATRTFEMWRLTEEQKQEATRRYEAGESCGVIAKDYGVSRQSMWDVLRRRTKMRDRVEALPRKEATAIREKRLRALRRYRSRATRITRPQIRAVWERDQVCQMCEDEGTDIDHVVPVSKGGQTELANLQLLCRPCHHEKSRVDRKGVVPTEAPSRSISSAEVSRSCAKTSPSPADEQDSAESDRPSSSSSPESLTLFSPMEDGCSLRTYPDFFPPTVDEISPSFSRRWPSSGFTTSPGECWTADTSECPSDGDGSTSLADVLAADVHLRFFLSQRAAAGILRRAEKRGRELPPALAEALQALASQSPDDARRTTRTSSPTDLPDATPRELTPTLSTPSSPTPSDQKASTLRRTEPEGELRSPSQEPSGAETTEPEGATSLTPTSSVRRLTPTECERLQSFPDGWTVLEPSTSEDAKRERGSKRTTSPASGPQRVAPVAPMSTAPDRKVA